MYPEPSSLFLDLLAADPPLLPSYFSRFLQTFQLVFFDFQLTLKKKPRHI